MVDNSVWSEMKKVDNITTTENGDKSYKSSLDNIVDMLFKGGIMFHASEDECYANFVKAYAEDPKIALTLLFYLRDVRGGQGCRNYFRNIMTRLSVSKPYIVSTLLEFFVEYGRWDDLIYLLKNKNIDKSLKSEIGKYIVKQLNTDMQRMVENKNISLLMKWMPSENTSSAETVALAKIVRNICKLDSKSYRKMLSAGRKYLKVVERNICANSFETIDYSSVPSKAMQKYTELFSKKDADHYLNYIIALKKGEAKVNANAVYPHEIVAKYYNISNDDNESKAMLDAQWKALPNYFEGKEDNSIVVADVSGSMLGTPMNVAISLALYIAERNKGVFHNKFITFSENPSLIEIDDKFETIADKFAFISDADWGMNTDLDKVFELLYNAVRNGGKVEDMPSTIYIISDMQFDDCCAGKDMSTFDKWKLLFEVDLGIKLPRIIFWNVRENQTVCFPVTINDEGVLLISGFSPSVMKYTLNGKLTNTKELIDDIVHSDRYEQIYKKLSESNFEL